MIEVLSLSHLLNGILGDRCLLEGDCRLRQDTAAQGGTSLKQNVGLDQKDALHVRVFTCQHLDMARNLPEDVRCNCTPCQDHFRVCDLLQVSRHLNDEDVGIIVFAWVCTFEGDVPVDGYVRAEGVDAGRQWSIFAAVQAVDTVTTENTGSDIDPRGIGIDAPRGVCVSSSHGADCEGQIRWTGWYVVRRVGPARDLFGRRKLSRRVQREAEARHGERGNGRDGDVACDVGGARRGDAARCEDHVVFGSQELDLGLAAQLALSTSDGIGICHKREARDEKEAASVGREHRDMEKLLLRERVKSI
jgi:hypothetical protein